LKSRLHASSPRVIVGAIEFREMKSVGYVNVSFRDRAHNLSEEAGNKDSVQLKLNNQQAST